MTAQTPIFHITDLTNLPVILTHGGLWALNKIQALNIGYQSIAYNSVQQRRAAKTVPCGPRGVLHDYVPLYFAPRSPMLYTINRGNVPSCPNGQKSVIYLVTTAEKVQAAGLGFVFSDGHGIMALSQFFDDLLHLDKIDWPLMRSKWWNQISTDLDRLRRRQAEFLVHQFLPWGLINEIAVMSRQAADIVQLYMASQGVTTTIAIRRDWYY